MRRAGIFASTVWWRIGFFVPQKLRLAASRAALRLCKQPPSTRCFAQAHAGQGRKPHHWRGDLPACYLPARRAPHARGPGGADQDGPRPPLPALKANGLANEADQDGPFSAPKYGAASRLAHSEGYDPGWEQSGTK